MRLFVGTFLLVDVTGNVGIEYGEVAGEWSLLKLPSELRNNKSDKFSLVMEIKVEKFSNLLKQLLQIAAFLSFKVYCQLPGRQQFAVTSSEMNWLSLIFIPKKGIIYYKTVDRRYNVSKSSLESQTFCWSENEKVIHTLHLTWGKYW